MDDHDARIVREEWLRAVGHSDAVAWALAAWAGSEGLAETDLASELAKLWAVRGPREGGHG